MEAARARFADDGFGATTIRQVARDAGVDPALVMQFFGSKNGLFAAVMSISPDTLARFNTVFDGPEDHLGERVVRAYLSAWEGPPHDSEPLTAMLRGAMVNEQARAQLRDFIQARLLDGIGARVADHDDAALRTGLASAMLVGIIVGRRIVGVPTLAEAETEAVVAMVAPAIQAVLSAGAGSAAGAASPSRARTAGRGP